MIWYLFDLLDWNVPVFIKKLWTLKPNEGFKDDRFALSD